MARLVSLNLDAALLEGALSKSSRPVTCREVADVTLLLARSSSTTPDLIVLGGDARAAADAAEAITDDSALLSVPLVAWQVRGTLADTSRLVALGVRMESANTD